MTTQATYGRSPLEDPGTDLASNRTALSFERTRMSADRTLMSVMRTALSLISFGFTIYQFISKFSGQRPHAAMAARNFGISLIILGIGTLIIGLISEFNTMSQLRHRRNTLNAAGLLRHGTGYRPSPTGVIALLLLVMGLVAIVGMALRIGPFG